MKVGYNNNKYPEKRCIIDKLTTIEYINCKNKNFLMGFKAIQKVFRPKKLSNVDYKYLSLPQQIDGYHFFNYVTTVNTPWITTYETFVPRIKETLNIHHCDATFPCTDKIYKELEVLASRNCKKLIALSKCNQSMQIELLKQYPTLYKKIKPKLTQINPPQQLLINDYSEKELSNQYIQFTFVGNDFVRKGGVEIVKALHKINKIGLYPIKLVLVTDINNRENYVFKDNQLTEKEFEEVENIIMNSPWIELYSNLPNDKVLNLMKNSHIGLLPTWGDTYGYSILEFQAAGCPVITTNVRAIPEINNDKCGWLIELNLNKHGELGITSFEERQIMSQKIIDGLINAISYILENPKSIKNKGEASLNRIAREHNPSEYANKLAQIYKESF